MRVILAMATNFGGKVHEKTAGRKKRKGTLIERNAGIIYTIYKIIEKQE